MVFAVVSLLFLEEEKLTLLLKVELLLLLLRRPLCGGEWERLRGVRAWQQQWLANCSPPASVRQIFYF